MTAFDKGKAVAWIRANALPKFGAGRCARHVRRALEAGGADCTGHPVSAKDWGPTLARIGFTELPLAGTEPQPGDVLVIDALQGKVHGHIQMFDGMAWVSDFVQRERWPGPVYRIEQPRCRLYRAP